MGPHYEIVSKVAQKITEPRLRLALIQVLEEYRQLYQDLERAKRRINDLDLFLKATVRVNHPHRVEKLYKPRKKKGHKNET